MNETIRKRKPERALHLVELPRRGLMRHRRQQRRGHRDRVAPQHEFHHPVRHVKRRDTAAGMRDDVAKIVSTKKLI